MEDDNLKSAIRECNICKDYLPFQPNPIFSYTDQSKIVIIGQAPGKKVHESNMPWDDRSGINLRAWLGVNEEQFYNPLNFALIPMGFCYPGKSKIGDLPPRKECAPLWHNQIYFQLKQVRLTILVGAFAQQYYLKEKRKKNLSATVKHYHEYLPNFFPIVHPSPLNFRWHTNNEWFKESVIPSLRETVRNTLQII